MFCGRVFIFLFQSFPLGDKSSVNLRGEFHVENITAFEHLDSKSRTAEGGMELDGGETTVQPSSTAGPDVSTMNGDDPTTAPHSTPQPVVITPDKQMVEGKGSPKRDIDYDKFYPIFWSLQEHFSNPPQLFDTNNLQKLKDGLELTLENFKALHKEVNSQANLRLLEEGKRGVKRKRGEGDDYMASNFNPKYLTSRELFELEVRFQRVDSRAWRVAADMPIAKRLGFPAAYSRPISDSPRLFALAHAKGEDQMGRAKLSEQVGSVSVHLER